MSQKKKNLKKNKLRYLKIIIIIVLLVWLVLKITPGLYYRFKPADLIYCHFENNITIETFPRYECVDIAINSKDMDEINLSQFESANFVFYECSDDYETLPKCEYKEKLYLSVYPLDILCRGCDTRGHVCVAYYIEYYINDSLLIKNYEEAIMQYETNSSDVLTELFLECGKNVGLD